jgi:hypothetical protein
MAPSISHHFNSLRENLQKIGDSETEKLISNAEKELNEQIEILAKQIKEVIKGSTKNHK